MIKVARSAILVVLAAALALMIPAIRAQQPEKPTPQNQPPQNPPPLESAKPQELPKELPKLSPEEEAAYKEFLQLKPDKPQAVADQGEAFLKKYPESAYRESVYSRLARVYQSLGQDQKAFEAATKALELNPDDVDILSMMAESIPRRVNPGDLDADQKLQKAEQYAKHAIDLLATLQKPAGMTDEDFTKTKNVELASCHSGLGLVYYYQKNVPGMISELEQATKLAPDDPVDFYLLGIGYNKAQRYTDAATAFGHCGETPGAMQARCKQGQEQAKKQASAQPPASKP